MSVCDPLNIFVVGEKLFCSTYAVIPKDSIFACKTKVSGRQEQEQVFCTVQVNTFVELKLLWNR